MLRQICGSPLAQPRAGDSLPVAVGGENGLAHAGSGEVVGKYSVHQIVDIPENISAVHPFLVIGRGGGDSEVIALIPVPLRIDPVQRKGHDGQNIGI